MISKAGGSFGGFGAKNAPTGVSRLLAGRVWSGDAEVPGWCCDTLHGTALDR
jgi:hypothetical protein